MWLRDPDALDYALIGAVTVLAYLQTPWRPEVRAALRDLAASVVAAVDGLVGFLTGVETNLYVVLALLLGVAFLVAIVELAPRLE